MDPPAESEPPIPGRLPDTTSIGQKSEWFARALVTSYHMERMVREFLCMRSYQMLSVLARAVAPDFSRTVMFLPAEVRGVGRTRIVTDHPIRPIVIPAHIDLFRTVAEGIDHIVNAIREFAIVLREERTKTLLVIYVVVRHKLIGVRGNVFANGGHVQILVAGVESETDKLWVQIYDPNGNYASPETGRGMTTTAFRTLFWTGMVLSRLPAHIGAGRLTPSLLVLGLRLKHLANDRTFSVSVRSVVALAELIKNSTVYPITEDLNNIKTFEAMIVDWRLGLPTEADRQRFNDTVIGGVGGVPGGADMNFVNERIVTGFRKAGVCSHIGDLFVLVAAVIEPRHDPVLFRHFMRQVLVSGASDSLPVRYDPPNPGLNYDAWRAVLALETMVYMDALSGTRVPAEQQFEPWMVDRPVRTHLGLSARLAVHQPPHRQNEARLTSDQILLALGPGGPLYPANLSGDTARFFMRVAPNQPLTAKKRQAMGDLRWGFGNLYRLFEVWVRSGHQLGIPELQSDAIQDLIWEHRDAMSVLARDGMSPPPFRAMAGVKFHLFRILRIESILRAFSRHQPHIQFWAGAPVTADLPLAAAVALMSATASGPGAPADPPRPIRIPIPAAEAMIWCAGAVLVPKLETRPRLMCFGNGHGYSAVQVVWQDILQPLGSYHRMMCLANWLSLLSAFDEEAIKRRLIYGIKADTHRLATETSGLLGPTPTAFDNIAMNFFAKARLVSGTAAETLARHLLLWHQFRPGFLTALFSNRLITEAVIEYVWQTGLPTIDSDFRNHLPVGSDLRVVAQKVYIPTVGVALDIAYRAVPRGMFSE